MKRLGALLIFVSIVACGKRGDPRPPVPVIPQATSDLVVAQRGSKVLLSWSYPSMTTAGQSLRDIRRVVLYRVSEELPAPPEGRDPRMVVPGELDPTVPRPVSLFSGVPALSATQFQKLRDRLDSIESANLGTATSGSRLLYEDSPPLQTRDGRPIRLTYAVVTESSTAEGAISNMVSIVPLPAPRVPAAVTSVAKAEGVEIRWQRPATEEGESIAGYNVYRTPAGEAPELLPTPINTTLVTGTSFTDQPTYGRYSYSVRTVAATGPPRIESEASVATVAEFNDLLPPPAPTTLTTLVETNRVRLVWDAVTAPDLDGYFVYRIENGVKLKISPKLTETNFIDTAPNPGIVYAYSVTAVDKRGNESAPTLSEDTLVPKTP